MNEETTCLRCSGAIAPDRVVLLSLIPVSTRRSAVEAFLTAPTLTLCSFCAATIAVCLERGTRITPIVSRPKRGAFRWCNLCDRAKSPTHACTYERNKSP